MPLEISYHQYGTHARGPEAAKALDNFFTEAPLYTPLNMDDELATACVELLYFTGIRVDTWCPRCERDSTFACGRLGEAALIDALKMRAESGTGHASYKVPVSEVDEQLRWLTFECA